MELEELSSSSSLPVVVWLLAVVDLASAALLALDEDPVPDVLLAGEEAEEVLEGLVELLLAGVLEAVVEGVLEGVLGLLAGALLAAGLGAGAGFGALAPEEPPILPVLNLRYPRP